jgi:hypothetical protein
MSNSSNSTLYYAGVDMTDWDYTYKEDDQKFIYKAFIALCNFAEDISGCSGCPLNSLCYGEKQNGNAFWNNLYATMADVNLR